MKSNNAEWLHVRTGSPVESLRSPFFWSEKLAGTTMPIFIYKTIGYELIRNVAPEYAKLPSHLWSWNFR